MGLRRRDEVAVRARKAHLGASNGDSGLLNADFAGLVSGGCTLHPHEMLNAVNDDRAVLAEQVVVGFG